MTALENFDPLMLWESYLLPWSINLTLALGILLVGRWLTLWLVGLLKKGLLKTKIEPMLVNFISSIIKALLLLLVFIAALSKLGVDTTSLIALVGAAGIAIGLALKDSLQNFASGVLLILFKPFKVGHFIEVAGVSGTVEAIHIFSSTLKTGDNKEIIIPNGEIYKDTIVNYSARDTRRVDMVFGISYDADFRQAKGILEKLVAEDERILPEPAPKIALSELADSSVNFIVRPWVNSADYWDVKWEMNEKVKLAFDEAGIGIPYPQMDVHLHSEKA